MNHSAAAAELYLRGRKRTRQGSGSAFVSRASVDGCASSCLVRRCAGACKQVRVIAAVIAGSCGASSKQERRQASLHITTQLFPKRCADVQGYSDI